VGLPLQQDCSCDCGNTARRRDLGDAGDLPCGISIGVLELASVASAARAFPPVWAARLCTLACIFACRLAHILACIRWFAVSRGSFGDHRLFCNAVIGKSGPNATEDGVIARCDGRLRIRTRRLRCCGSRVLMHLSRRFVIVFSVFLGSIPLLRSAAAAEAYLIADAQTGYILDEQEPRKKTASRQPDENCDCKCGARLG